MSRLVAAGYVRKVFKGWALTTQGTEKLNELGPVPGLNPQSKSFRDSVMKAPHYEPADYQAPARPGSEDFLELPSRIGNKLYYRDGTVEEITNGH
jgi:hypothetical protein